MNEKNGPALEAPTQSSHSDHTDRIRQHGGLQEPLPGVARGDMTQVVGATASERADVWIDENPHVYREIERRTLRLVTAGRKRFSLYEVVSAARFDAAVSGTTGDGFKINNGHVPTIARRLIETHPQLAEVLEVRLTKAERQANLVNGQRS